MEEYEFDKTRKSIRSNELASDDRKDMLQKFRGAGGEVLREKSLRKEEPDSGSGGGRRAGGSSAPDIKMPSELARERNRAQAEKQAAARRQAEREEKEATSFMARFFLKLRCKMGGVTPFGSDMVSPKFLSILNLDAKRAIMECQILGNDLFMNNAKIARTIVKELDDKNPLLVELIQRASELYNRNELSELVGNYTPSNPMAQPLEVLRAPLFSTLRKLYYLKPFQETYLAAVDAAVDIQQKEEGKQANLYAMKKKKIRQEWRTLMNTIYPGLVLLAQRAEMKKADPGSRLFEEMLGILDSDRIGQRAAGDPVGAIEAEAKKKPEDSGQDNKSDTEMGEEQDEKPEDKKEQQLSKELVYGYRLMKIHPAEALRKKHDPNGNYKYMPLKDKVFLAFLFFREFEEEYSFILTTPQVKLNASYEAGVKQDYRQKMADTFEQSRVPIDRFKEYFHEAEEYYRLSSEASSAMNYVEHQKRIQLVESRMGGKGRDARMQTSEYFNKLAAIFKVLIIDMRGSNQIVLNKDEPIKFQMERDLKKRLNGKPVKDCIMQAYCFSVGLAHRLKDGDLFGGVIEMSDEEFAEAFDPTIL